MERRDEAEEVERFPSAGTAEFPGIVEANPKADSDIKQMSGRRQVNRNRVSSDATVWLAEDKA